jgi:RNase P subunit RPR2
MMVKMVERGENIMSLNNSKNCLVPPSNNSLAYKNLSITEGYDYPTNRTEYTYTVGHAGEHAITEILRESNCNVVEHRITENGVDIKLEDDPEIGIEVWNWSDAHVYNDRTNSVLDNLKPFTFRFLVASFLTEETRNYIIDFYVDNPVMVIELGFQILPKEYEDFYRKKKDTKGKLFLTDRTKDSVKHKIKPIIKMIKKYEFDKLAFKHSKHILETSDTVVFDFTGEDEEKRVKSFERDLKDYKQTVHLIGVPESLCSKSLSAKEANLAYVYNPSINTISKDSSNNISKINIEISKANCEEKHQLKPTTELTTETLMKNTRFLDQKLTNTLKEIFKSVLNKVNYQRRRKEFQEVRAMADRTVTPSLFRHYKKLNVPLCCSKCGRSFSIGDKYARISKTNLYCPKCAETMFYDLPDSNEEMTYNFVTEGNTIEVKERI